MYLFCLVACSKIFNPSFSQNYKIQQNQVLVYNIILNGAIGGIGGTINKQKCEKYYTAFARNFLKGCAGGGIKYIAKHDVYSLTYSNRTYIAKGNRLLYYIGYSIVQNASLNREIWHSFYCQFYGANMEFTLKNKFHFKSRISVSTLFSLSYFWLTDNSLNIQKSLEYGLFFFNQNPKYNLIRAGSANPNAMAIRMDHINPDFRQSVIAHEFIHTYQFPDYYPITNFFRPLLKNAGSNKLYKNLSRFFFLEIEYQSLIYAVQPKPVHFGNFFEFEAQHFATRQYIPR